MASKLDDVALLKAVLAARNNPAIRRCDDDQSLLRSLLAAAPKTLKHHRKSTLFEAMHVLDLENPHSDFLAWLLDPFGPLTDNWLLKSLLKRIAPHWSWEGDPTVEREVPVGNGRLDILISWSSFKLIIENKVWSEEGNQQIARYLQSSEITRSDNGCIVYLTPDGRRPTSIGLDDARVTAISYRELAAMIEAGLRSSTETEARGRIFAEEFRNCIMRLLKVRFEMTKPPISESTRIYLGQAKRLAQIKSHAIDEFAEFLQWLYSEAERRLQRFMGSEVVTHRGKYVAVFRLPNWKRDDVIFGFYFGMDYDPTRTLISEAKYGGPWVGVGAWRMDDSTDYEGCKVVVDLLSSRLAKVWPRKEDLCDPDHTMALWREMRIPEDGDVNAWAEAVMKFLEELASGLTQTLKEISYQPRP
jgi:hypothetical protein